MADKYEDNFIGIAVHGGDPMMIPDYIDFMNVNGYPSSNIGRRVFGLNPDPQNLDLIYKERIKQITFASIEDELSFDETSRLVTIDLSSEFVIPQSGDFRYAVVIIEDDVTGEGFGFIQANYYSSEAAGIDLFSLDGTNWKNLPEVILAENIDYDHVARHLLGGYEGVENSLPAEIELNTEYEYTFEYTLPDSVNAEKVHIVSLLLDATESEIINAISTKLPKQVGVADQDFAKQVKLYPNPMVNEAIVDFDFDGSAEVQMSIIDLDGRIIANYDFGIIQSNKMIKINAENMIQGVYVAQIIIDGRIVSKKFTVIRK